MCMGLLAFNSIINFKFLLTLYEIYFNDNNFIFNCNYFKSKNIMSALSLDIGTANIYQVWIGVIETKKHAYVQMVSDIV